MQDLRPISLLSVPSKILEKIVHIQIVNYLNLHKILPLHQSGFRKSHSTTTALLNLCDNIIRALDKGRAVVSVSLDYSKAFDTIDHGLLCAKLFFYGFDENAVAFFKSYLCNRRQSVSVNNFVSPTQLISSGIPQGSILGPLLFIIYTADIFNQINHSHLQSYADDTQLLYDFNPSDAAIANTLLNDDLDSICRYSKEHNLKINPSKSVALLFSSKNRRDFLKTQLFPVIDGENIKFSNCAKNLGIFLDQNLRFVEHIKLLLQKTYARMKFLYSNRHILNFKMRKKMCESLILPIFNYCNILYYPCLDQTTKNRLQIVQNTCCRFIFNLRKYDHISEKYVELRWLRMDNIVKLHFLIFLYRLFHSSAPPYLREKLIFRNVVHNRNIRHQYTLTMPHHSTAFFQRCFTYSAIMLYNSVKPNMCLSLYVFRRQMKQMLISRQLSS